MINSLFMLGSSYNKNRSVSTGFMIAWLIYMFVGSDAVLGVTFPMVNALVFLGISVLINLVKNKTANTILSICSILIWSIVIDTICYFMYPMFTAGQSIFAYIYQGILFNGKYIFTNIVAVCVIYAVDVLIEKCGQKAKVC